MIDDKKIEESATHYADENSMYIDHPMGDTYIMEKLSDAYKAGAEWAIDKFLKDLWHPASEKPNIKQGECCVTCLVKFKNGSTEGDAIIDTLENLKVLKRRLKEEYGS